MSDVFDLSPVRAPSVRATPVGVREDFVHLVSQAGLLNVVSTNSWPEVRVHGGAADFKVAQPGRTIYCIAGGSLPPEPKARAREIVRRLAYGFHDWAAREIVGRYHRDLKRMNVQVEDQKLVKASVRIRRFLRSNPHSSIGEIASATGIAQPNVSRAISNWIERGLVVVDKSGRETRCSLREPVADATVTEAQTLGMGM